MKNSTRRHLTITRGTRGRHLDQNAFQTLTNKSEALKKLALHQLIEAKKAFVAQADTFYGLDKRRPEDYQTFCQAALTTLDEVLEGGDWDSSLFLRNALKVLRPLREKALALQSQLKEIQPTAGHDQRGVVHPRLSEEHVKLYITLYQVNGLDLKQWEVKLTSLAASVVGRPIYQTEEAAQQALRTKLSQTSEGYVVVAIDPTKIVAVGRWTRHDRLGNSLVNVLPGSVTEHSILEFVHQGKRYSFKDRQLIPILDKKYG